MLLHHYAVADTDAAITMLREHHAVENMMMLQRRSSARGVRARGVV